MSSPRLSPHFSLDEFTRSQTASRRGIDNRVEPGSTIHTHLTALCRLLLQPIRDGLGPVHITSGYRSPNLNAAIGGSSTSQHADGLAADIVVSGYSPLEVCRWVVRNNLPYDQLIHEFGRWVHLSIAAAGDARRGEQLTAYKAEGKTVYSPGIHPIEALT